jgi:hypothetical protein
MRRTGGAVVGGTARRRVGDGMARHADPGAGAAVRLAARASHGGRPAARPPARRRSALLAHPRVRARARAAGAPLPGRGVLARRAGRARRAHAAARQLHARERRRARAPGPAQPRPAQQPAARDVPAEPGRPGDVPVLAQRAGKCARGREPGGRGGGRRAAVRGRKRAWGGGREAQVVGAGGAGGRGQGHLRRRVLVLLLLVQPGQPGARRALRQPRGRLGAHGHPLPRRRAHRGVLQRARVGRRVPLGGLRAAGQAGASQTRSKGQG